MIARVLCGVVRAAVLFGLAGGVCRADGSAGPNATTAAFEVVRPVGDVYNERTSDGDSYPEALGVRAFASTRGYAVWIDYRRNVYLTESGGPGALTQYARLEGGYGTVVPFLARDSSFEARAERALGLRGVYAGIGFDQTWENYHYPSLRGFGAGLEKRASDVPGIRPFGSIYYYPWMSGAYTTETLPPRALNPNFRILKIDYGFRIQVRAPVYFVAGYGNEFRRAQGLPAQIRFIRSDLSLGFGARL